MRSLEVYRVLSATLSLISSEERVKARIYCLIIGHPKDCFIRCPNSLKLVKKKLNVCDFFNLQGCLGHEGESSEPTGCSLWCFQPTQFCNQYPFDPFDQYKIIMSDVASSGINLTNMFPLAFLLQVKLSPSYGFFCVEEYLVPDSNVELIWYHLCGETQQWSAIGERNSRLY